MFWNTTGQRLFVFLPYGMRAPTVVATESNLNALIEATILQNGPQCSLNHIDVSDIRDFGFLFTNHPTFNGDISQWNVSKATSMTAMFEGTQFNGDISNWNVSNVVHFDMMFRRSAFNNDISKWNVSRATDMSSMFEDAPFCQDISEWNVGSLITMNDMFAHSEFDGDLSLWDVSGVCEMHSLFSHCTTFQGDISRWNVGNVKVMHSLFMRTEFNGDISSWDVRNVENMCAMFQGSKFNGDLSSWDVRNVVDARYMFSGSLFEQDISAWCFSKKPKLTRFCIENAMFLPKQSKMPWWLVQLHLEERLRPREVDWALAFDKVALIAPSLNLSRQEQAALIVSTYHGVGLNEMQDNIDSDLFG